MMVTLKRNKIIASAVHDGYSMMEEAEIQAGKRFDYVMRLRPDTRPTMFSILDEQHHLPLSGNSTVTIFGDGHAIMSRESSDVYFNVYQTYGHFCDTHLKLNNGQYLWGENPDHYFSKFVSEEKGVGLSNHGNFSFWFRRPHSCAQLCGESLGFV